jgi:beta-glucanase (GH16 family)
MKLIFCILFSLVAQLIWAQSEWHQKKALHYPHVLNPLQKPGYQLVYGDEFTSGTFNHSIWEQENNSSADSWHCYVDEPNRGGSNYDYSNGNTIKLIIKEEKVTGTVYNWDVSPPLAYDKKYDYSTALFISRRLFIHGYFEIRCKLPKGRALWPAFWLYGEDWDEIDIFEIFGHELNTIATNYHWKGNIGIGTNCDENITNWCHNSRNIQIASPDFSEEFYTFGLEWSTSSLKFYLNNKLIRSIDKDCNVPKTPMRVVTGIGVSNFHGKPPSSIFPAALEVDYIRIYKKIWLEDFTFNKGYEVNKHLRLMADVNGDGMEDIVAFGNEGVFVALSAAEGFSEPKLRLSSFGFNQGWAQEKYPRHLADVNGDGMADIVGFGKEGVWVSLAYLGKNGPGFLQPSLFSTHFGTNTGWDNQKHRRLLADVNRDGRMDIIGIGDEGVYFALSTEEKGVCSFTPPQLVQEFYGQSQGWDIKEHIVLTADVNRDGRADIIGFGKEGVYVSLAQKDRTGFHPPELWSQSFNPLSVGWNPTKHIRSLADVNGDGRDDIVGFGDNGVFVALSTGESFLQPELWVEDFGYHKGNWDVNLHPRYLADMNGDGRADIVGFGREGVWVSLAYEDNSGRGFRQPKLWMNDYGTNENTGAYHPEKHLRMLSDVNGDGIMDLVAFGNEGVFVTTSPDCRLSDEIAEKRGFDTNGSIIRPIHIYPNPSEGSFLVTGAKHFETIEIYNSMGTLMERRRNNQKENLVPFNLHNLPNGIYYIRFASPGRTTAEKIIISR